MRKKCPLRLGPTGRQMDRQTKVCIELLTTAKSTPVRLIPHISGTNEQKSTHIPCTLSNAQKACWNTLAKLLPHLSWTNELKALKFHVLYQMLQEHAGNSSCPQAAMTMLYCVRHMTSTSWYWCTGDILTDILMTVTLLLLHVLHSICVLLC